jgi:small subunit ribosomal protein S20
LAHSLSARKRVRQNEKRRARNKARTSGLKSQLRKTTAALSGNDAKAAAEAFTDAVRVLDRAATLGTLHRNAAARRKSKLARKLNAAKKAAAAKPAATA